MAINKFLIRKISNRYVSDSLGTNLYALCCVVRKLRVSTRNMNMIIRPLWLKRKLNRKGMMLHQILFRIVGNTTNILRQNNIRLLLLLDEIIRLQKMLLCLIIGRSNDTFR